MTRLRARFDGKVLVPVEPVDLPRGQILNVEIEVEAEEADETRPAPGTPAAILEAVRQSPHVDPEIVDELERVIEESMLPARFDSPFVDHDGDAQP